MFAARLSLHIENHHDACCHKARNLDTGTESRASTEARGAGKTASEASIGYAAEDERYRQLGTGRYPVFRLRLSLVGHHG